MLKTFSRKRRLEEIPEGRVIESPPVKKERGKREVVQGRDVLREKGGRADGREMEVRAFREMEALRMEKIGESTFSEIFKNRESGHVYKIIPIGREAWALPHTPMEEFIAECEVMRILGGVEEVIGVREAYMVRGEYPEKMLREWRKYKRKKRGVNEIPSGTNTSGLFGVVVMEDGGTELEKCRLKRGEKIKLLLELASTIQRLERLFGFEHRDMHQSNVLVRRSKERVSFKIIDFSISRIDAPSLWFSTSPQKRRSSLEVREEAVKIMKMESKRILFKTGPVIYNDLDKSRWIFEGGAEMQYEVYRRMDQEYSGERRWRMRGRSNDMWLAYLVRRMGREESFEQWAEIIESQGIDAFIGHVKRQEPLWS
jgi:Haspin like kinase domain